MESAQAIERLLSSASTGSEFYRRVLLRAGYDPSIRFSARFAELPVTTRRDLQEHGERIRDPRYPIAQITSTGGTSANPVILWRTEEELQAAEKTICDLYRIVALEPRAKIAIILPFGIWNIGHLCLRGARLAGLSAIPIDVTMPPKSILGILTHIRPDCIFTHPGIFSQLDRVIDESGADPSKHLPVRTILWAGEHFSESRRTAIQHRWNARVHSVYGSEEIDALGVECKEQHGLHLFETSVLYEVVSPEDHTRELTEGKIGRLLVTPLDKLAMPLIRYDLGDIAEFLPGDCSCGWPGRKLRLHGRANEMLTLADASKIFPHQIEDILEDVRMSVTAYQLQLDGVPEHEELVLLIDTRDDGRTVAQLDAIRNRLSGLVHLTERVQAGHLSVAVRIATTAAMVHTGKGKTRRLVDLRTCEHRHQ